MIADILGQGARNALNGRYLCGVLGLSMRELGKQIETERRQGAPICATSDKNNPGYYLAADSETMAIYCKRLEHREQEIAATLEACKRTMHKLPHRDN